MAFSESSTILLTSIDMMHLYATNTVYHAYLGSAFVLFCITLFTYHKYYNSRMKARILLWNHSFVEPFCYAVSSSIIGTQAVLNAKCMSMLLQVKKIINRYIIVFFLLMLLNVGVAPRYLYRSSSLVRVGNSFDVARPRGVLAQQT